MNDTMTYDWDDGWEGSAIADGYDTLLCVWTAFNGYPGKGGGGAVVA